MTVLITEEEIKDITELLLAAADVRDQLVRYVSEPGLQLPDWNRMHAAIENLAVPMLPAGSAAAAHPGAPNAWMHTALTALKAQHSAIDHMAAKLIHLEPGFYPSKDAIVWEGLAQGHNAIEMADFDRASDELRAEKGRGSSMEEVLQRAAGY